jgi:Pyruvate/2-oxoacid:ferredoxin oxidoreductase delta subunit
MKVLRKIIKIDESLCNGCGQCIVDCAESALEIINGKATIVSDKYCDGLGACMNGCPTGALTIVEREADDFDEEAVEELIRRKKAEALPTTTPCGCPSAQIQNFKPSGQSPCQQANQATGQNSSVSALSHWPVQIRLVPPSAPFLRNADLLIAADCTPIAYAGFHQDLLQGRVVLMGCPKFDDGESYVQKFTEIFSQVPVKSATVAIMEVPCCQTMKHIVKKALTNSGKTIAIDVITISTQGAIINRATL